MNCRDAREFADPFLSDQLLLETTSDIVRHLETCAACREEFASRKLLRTRLKTAIDTSSDLSPRPEFVASLATRLRPVEAPRAITRRAWLESWMAAAAAVIALIGGGLFARDTLRRSRLAALAASAAGDHQNCAIRFNLHEAPIPLEQAAQKYDPAYRSLTAFTPTGLPGGDATVLDRHSCVFDGRRFAHVVFRYREHIVSLLVTSGAGLAGDSPSLVPNDSGLRVALFDAASHAVFVVSDLPDRDTLLVAQTLSNPVRRALSLS